MTNPKFYKIKLSKRFVISYASCFIKSLSRMFCLAMKSVYSCIVNYCNMLNTVTRILQFHPTNIDNPECQHVPLRGGGGGSPLKFWKTRFRDNG